MKFLNLRLIILVSLVALLGGCGYYFPHVYEGPDRTIYMPQWKNRTSQLGLDTEIYQSLSRWFQKSRAINMSKDKAQADMILAGEIVYIELPSVAWGGDARTTDVKVRLGVRYVLKDLQSGKILWEVPDELWTEDYSTRDDNITAEQEALKQIIDDLSERIFLGTLDKLRRADKQAASSN